jgi:hypothetical protein
MKRPFVLSLTLALGSVGCAAGPTAASAPAPHMMLAQATPSGTAPGTGSAPATAPATATDPGPDAPPPPPPPPGPPPPPPAKSETYAERDNRQLGRTWGWSLVAVGASFGAIALGTSYLMLRDKSTEDANCVGKVCNGAGLSANGELAGLGGWNLATWIVGVVGTGAGIYLLLTNPTDKAMGTQIEIAPTSSGGGGVSLRRAF